MTIKYIPCRVGLVVSVSASRTVGREFASRPGHTKDHHQNGIKGEENPKSRFSISIFDSLGVCLMHVHSYKHATLY